MCFEGVRASFAKVGRYLVNTSILLPSIVTIGCVLVLELGGDFAIGEVGCIFE